MTTPHNTGTNTVAFRRTPNTAPPEMPDFTLADKERDGLAAGYPLHLCHMLEYAWAMAMPDSALCREYVNWFIQECPCYQYGLMTMNSEDFAKMWGPNMTAAIELTIRTKGHPPILWHMVSFINGYDAGTGTFFDVPDDHDISVLQSTSPEAGHMLPVASIAVQRQQPGTYPNGCQRP